MFWDIVFWIIIIGIALTFGQMIFSIVFAIIIWIVVGTIALIAAAIGGIVDMFKGDDER